MKNLGLLILRLIVGSMVAAHGAQKLFGWFGGPGLKGTQGFMESLGMRPGKIWGTMAGMAEFSGGTMTALGFLHPFGPLNIIAAMSVAMRKVHWKLPLFASEGGAELPLTNAAVATAVLFAGSGRYSLDRMLGIRIPRWLSMLSAAMTIAGVYTALERPEMAEKVLGTTSNAVTEATQPANEPQLEVETRPRQAEPQTAQQEQTQTVG